MWPVIGIGPFFRKGGGNNPFVSEFISRVISEGGSVTGAEISALNTFANSIDLSEFDRFWIHGLQNQIAAKVSLANAATAPIITEVNAPTFTAGIGFTGDGTTDYLDLNFNPSIDGVQYTQNNCSFGTYAQSALANGYIMGGGDGVRFVGLRPLNGGNFTAEINSVASIVGASPSASGFWSVGRTGSTNPFIYRNGSSLTITTNPNLASNGLPAAETSSLGYGATPTSTNTVSITFFGSSDINQTDLNAAVQALATALGFNV